MREACCLVDAELWIGVADENFRVDDEVRREHVCGYVDDAAKAADVRVGTKGGVKGDELVDGFGAGHAGVAVEDQDGVGAVREGVHDSGPNPIDFGGEGWVGGFEAD